MAGGRRGAAVGTFWAGVWLVYLVPGLLGLLAGDHGGTARWLGPIGLVVFAAAYLRLMHLAWAPRFSPDVIDPPERITGWPRPSGAGPRRPWSQSTPEDRALVPGLVGLGVLALALTAAFGEGALSTLVFLGPSCASVLAGRAAAAGVLGAAATTAVAALLLRAGTADVLFAAFPTVMAGAIVLGIRRMYAVIEELEATRGEVRRLAAAAERSRLGRDLHDLLGHGLTVISVKSQLAGRLLERGEHERAAVEVAELEDVARTALREVREVVSEYRARPLATELAAARGTIEGAGLRAEVPQAAGTVPAAAEATLGFVVREGVTNVLRHARAERCAVRAAGTAEGGFVVEVRDDGRGPPGRGPVAVVRPGEASGDGNGLAGLAERLAEVDGRLEAGAPPEGGHLLRATVPAAASGPAAEVTA